MLDPSMDPVKLVAKFESGPEKKVLTHKDLSNWQCSQAYHDLIGYINATSTEIQGIKTTDEVYESDVMLKLCQIFDKLSKIVDANPPEDQPQRFGNKAYRSWARAMYRDIYFMLEQAIPQEKCQMLNELGQYLSQSFGNSTRIDYGTGHELSFIFFLCSLFKADILTERDTVAAALRLFNRYLLFVRRLQRVYNMEPAGSHGVWSLDDYQFVPFIWGSAQLSYNPPFDPAKFLDENIINDYKDKYMFMGCIDYISKVKTGHFGEHSNQLWSITAVPSWVKINSGLVKMYQKEILSKFPVLQHVYFGDLMSFEPLPTGTPHLQARLGYKLSKMVPPTPPTSMRSTAFSAVSAGALSSDTAMSTGETETGSSTSSEGSVFKRMRTNLQATINKDSSVAFPMPHKPEVTTVGITMVVSDSTIYTKSPVKVDDKEDDKKPGDEA